MASGSATSSMVVSDHFTRLPAGAVQAGGWIERQMREDGDGWVRIASEMSAEGLWLTGVQGGWQRGIDNIEQGKKGAFYLPLIDREGVHTKVPGNGEYQIHWLDIAIRLGWEGDMESYRRLAKQGIDDILASADSDGYMGVNQPKDRFNGASTADGVFEIHSVGALINTLMTYYRLSGDGRVPPACLKLADLYLDHVGPDHPEARPMLMGQAWYSGMADAMVALYSFSGDPKYLEAAKYFLGAFMEALGTKRAISENATIAGHTAGWGITLLSMLEVYRASGDPELLTLIEKAQRMIMEQHMQPHGAPSGHWESLAGTGPYLNTETCDTFWFAWFWMEMASLTGDPAYVDLVEKAVFNALPAARDKDGRVVAYFIAPNELAACRTTSKTEFPARIFIECCQANSPRLWPILSERMVETTPEGGLALMLYGSCTATATLADGRRVTLTEETAYPFEETVRLSIGTGGAPCRFPLQARIPGWCSGASIRINGQPLDLACPAGQWVIVDREWADGDEVEISLPMGVKVSKGEGQVALVERGPLLYTLPVAGERRPLDRWGSFEELPAGDSAWNYALVIDPSDPVAAFKPVKQGEPLAADHVWQQAPLALEADAVRLPGWTFTPGREASRPLTPAVPPQPEPWIGLYGVIGQPSSPLLPSPPFKFDAKVERVRLVPIGFTTLRMTCLPTVSPADVQAAGPAPDQPASQ